jgi:hypothetical protein
MLLTGQLGERAFRVELALAGEEVLEALARQLDVLLRPGARCNT